ncbi:MAG TPA: RNA polymerase sigma factor [Elusimicrobiota bacterium]|nr:RNA polymerase sigma factor [Elusimicrobiota bacterium]
MPRVVEDLYRTESRMILATLIRLLGDFDRAEDAMHEAFQAALQRWPVGGVPKNPSAWLISAGRFKGIDRRRRDARAASLDEIPDRPQTNAEAEDVQQPPVGDDRLRLMFNCCHPALTPEARTALTLREVCGLTTEEIARAFLAQPAAVAQRIVRAKNRIKEERIPYEVPSPEELPARLDAVLQVIYLVFNEGYYASAGDSLTRADLSAEAIRLGRLLVQLLPEPETKGLLALMLLHESRRSARSTAEGDVILIADQDRSLWDKDRILEGVPLAEEAMRSPRLGPYAVQAAIAALHAEAPNGQATDWKEISALYDLLMRVRPSPVVELNRAVAVAMRDGPASGLALVDDLLARGELDGYPLLYSVRADLCRRLGRTQDAREAYRQALVLARQTPERKFLEKRLAELD